jgi:hypothetical protein
MVIVVVTVVVIGVVMAVDSCGGSGGSGLEVAKGLVVIGDLTMVVVVDRSGCRCTVYGSIIV